MSYEQFRHKVVSRLMGADIPPGLLTRCMLEIDAAAQDFSFEPCCKDLTVWNDGVPEIVKIFTAAMVVKNCQKTTIRDYVSSLLKMFSTIRKPYTQITTNDIRLYLFNSQASRNWKPETTEHKRVIINTFFNFCLDSEYITRNPARCIDPLRLPKKKPKPLTQTELEIMRSHCESLREKALIDTFFSTGMRVSECAAVTLRDIDWRDRSIIVRHGKGDKERFVYFNAEAEISLKRYLKNRKGNSDYLFCKQRAPYTNLRREALEVEIRRVRERCGDEISVKTVPHTLRRTMATTASEHGMPIEEVQALMGHESPETTMHYIEMARRSVKSNYDRCMAG